MRSLALVLIAASTSARRLNEGADDTTMYGSDASMTTGTTQDFEGGATQGAGQDMYGSDEGKDDNEGEYAGQDSMYGSDAAGNQGDNEGEHMGQDMYGSDAAGSTGSSANNDHGNAVPCADASEIWSDDGRNFDDCSAAVQKLGCTNVRSVRSHEMSLASSHRHTAT
jgi:hypothetical protein